MSVSSKKKLAPLPRTRKFRGIPVKILCKNPLIQTRNMMNFDLDVDPDVDHDFDHVKIVHLVVQALADETQSSYSIINK